MDKKRKDKYYQIGNHVYLKVKAKQSSLILGSCGNLAPRFCGPFEILAKRGPMAYEIVLPTHIRFHNVFHASLLKKYVLILNMWLIGPYYRWNLRGDFPLILCLYWIGEKCSFGSAL